MSVVYDSKDREYQLENRWHDSVCHMFHYLDGRRIEPDDRLGWVFISPDGDPKPIRDGILKDNIDRVVFGQIIPTGGDVESDD